MNMTRDRLQSIGWFTLLAICAVMTGSLMLRVNSVKSQVEISQRQVIALRRANQFLETEYETRANQQQLSAINDLDFGYKAPDTGQYLANERQLAMLGKPRGLDAPAPIEVASADAPDGSGAIARLVPQLIGRAMAAPAPATGSHERGATLLRAGAPGGGGMRGPAAGTLQRMEVSDVRKRAVNQAKWRARWVLRVFGVIALGALAQIAHLGLFESDPPSNGTDTLLPDRGDIVDRNGVPLARAFPAYSLWFNPKALGDGSPLVQSPAVVAAALQRIFPDMNVADLTARLASGKPGYLRRRILPDDANRIHALGEPALEFPRESERYYPQGSMGAHFLGYVDAEGHGQYGMEQVLDHRLTDRAQRGSATVLSIDTRVQGALEDELLRAIRLSNAKGGGALVMDVDTGEVLGLASLPSFDPNTPKILAADGQKLMRNHITSETYELGSVFKPLTVASAIEAGTITNLARRYPANGQRMVGGHLVHDDKNFGATLDVPEALVHSSNVVLAQVGEELGGERLGATLRSLGFDRRPMIELPGRGMPSWPRGKWSQVTTTTIAYGHGLAVTPLHIACAYAALVNGGVWHPATLMKLEPGQVPEGRRVFKASTSARMRQLLRLITEVGTGRSANAPGFRVGGKTGTAEIGDRNGYHKDRVITTFSSAFPMDHPRYLVLATLEEPKATAATSGQRTAAWNAAPVVGRVVPRIGPLLGIMPDDSHDIDVSDVRPLIANGEGE